MKKTYEAILEARLAEMSSLSRIKRSIDKYDTGIITACRGNLTYRQNMERNIELVSTLRDEGFGVTAVKGAYVEDMAGINPREVKENSFFVTDNGVGDLKNRLKQLGAQYDQDSILFIPQGGKGTLIGTSDRDDAYPSKDVEDEQGEFLALGDKTLNNNEFRSRVRNRPFAFTDKRT